MNSNCLICCSPLIKRYFESVKMFTKRKYCSRLCFYKSEKIFSHNRRRWGEESRKKASERMKGSNHWNWQGGKSTQSELIRHSIDNKVWARKIFVRDGFCCKLCLSYGKKITAHHIKRFAYYPELRFEVNNGITLCRECHKKVNWNEEEYECLFTGIINNLKRVDG